MDLGHYIKLVNEEGKLFQFLIGKLQTETFRCGDVRAPHVSIPHR